MRIYKFLLFFAVFGFTTSLTLAQNLGRSPYSRLGIGDLADPSFSRNAGMGGSGVALHHNFQLNSLNPAALASLRFTNFEFGVSTKKEKLSTTDGSQFGTAGNIHHMSLSIPLHKRYVVQIGARPFSSVNYQDVTDYHIREKQIEVTYKGNGGLGEFFFGNAYNYKDWLMIGLNMGYVAGQITYYRSQEDIGNNLYVTQTKSNQSFMRISPGILITRKLKKDRPVAPLVFDSITKDTILKRPTIKRILVDKAGEDWYYGLGLTGSLYHTLTAYKAEYFSRAVFYPSSGGYPTPYSVDTLSSGYTTSQYKLPSSVRLGFSLYKLNKIAYALDYYYSNWTTFTVQDFAQFRAQHTIAAGVELIPVFGSSKLYKRISYRAGANVSSLPYTVQGQSLAQWQLSLGAGIILPKSGVTLNFSLSYGQRGTTSANLIKENYGLLTIGVISNNKWFIRHKHD